jgi:hypothetical protein
MGGKPSQLEGKMHLSGKLSDWSFGDLLQIMQVTDKTGSLDIEGESQGRVHFRDGRVTGAELAAEDRSVVGEERSGVSDILYVLSTIEEGTFSVGAADGPDVKGWTVEELAADVEGLRLLEAEVVDAGLFDATGVRIIPAIDVPLKIESEDWHVLAGLVPAFTFELLETRNGRGSAVRILHTLHRLGLVEVFAGEEGETDWLNRLADDVAPSSAQPTPVEPPAEDPVEPAVDDAPEAPAAETESEGDNEPAADEEDPAAVEDAPVEPVADADNTRSVKGVSAPASTTLTDGVYDEIRRLRSRVTDS